MRLNEGRTFAPGVLIAGCLLFVSIGGAGGWWIGLSYAPLIAVQEAACPTPRAADVTGGGSTGSISSGEIDALEDSLMIRLGLLAQLGSVEGLALDATREDLTAADAVAAIIDALPDRELQILATMLTGMEEAEIGPVDDMRSFTARLAQLALEAEGGGDDSPDGQALSDTSAAPTLLFAAERELLNPRQVARPLFDVDADRVYAMVETAGITQPSLVIRWARIDRPRVLQLTRVPVQTGSNWTADSYGSGRGWAPGSYRVSVYTGDAAMRPIASGTFSVAPREDR